jgi:hypothetical protein
VFIECSFKIIMFSKSFSKDHGSVISYVACPILLA